VKAQIRAVVAFALIVLWAISALPGFTGMLPQLASVPGDLILLFLTKAAWGMCILD